MNAKTAACDSTINRDKIFVLIITEALLVSEFKRNGTVDAVVVLVVKFGNSGNSVLGEQLVFHKSSLFLG